MQGKIIQVEERVPLGKGFALSLQHMFAMFGASVLVPMLFGINPGVVLLMNGIGTLIFILITKGKAPAYLGSSFAFLSPVFMIIGTTPDPSKYPLALGGFVVVGLAICVVALIIRLFGTKWIDIILPPAAMGPIVALIGLTLAGTAASNGGLPVTGIDLSAIDYRNVIVFCITLLVAVFGSVLFRKFLAVIPILISIVVGYIAAALFGLVDFGPVAHASIFSLPDFRAPVFNSTAILTILPATLVIVTEHIGHQMVTSKIVGRDLIKSPGLHKTLLSDGISTALSGFVGAVPTTTYGENIGVMAITKVYSVWVIGGAAVISIVIAFIGPISALIQSIPWSVIGGVSFMLYGMIAASGLRLLVEAKVDYSKSRNLALTSVVFVTGLSGAYIPLGSFQLTGLTLATIVGMLLGLIFWVLDKAKLTNDRDDAPAK
ncbi:uracil permease [Sporobacter termitidis DSM 10068]|uniref:Uracil permease n=1 Tax=Sporobacter termitidis DSM 10068 TaxID=1123282 RepID=A0A1M5VPM8_9FIRM|nr:uracil permease [Sporobacter termitidis]SHH77216.1 uracil permease [Sporobacter termitidis DSM 10068]